MEHHDIAPAAESGAVRRQALVTSFGARALGGGLDLDALLAEAAAHAAAALGVERAKVLQHRPEAGEGGRHRTGLDFAHITALGGQARIQKAGSVAMNARASATDRTAPNGPAGPQASRRHQRTSTRSPDGIGFSRATGAPVRVEVRV